MKMTPDERLQQRLARELPPDDLALQSDAELEAILDAESTAQGGTAWFGWAAAAAAVILVAAVWATSSGTAEPGGVAESKPPAEQTASIDLPPGEPEHVGTPTPPEPVEEKWVEIRPEIPSLIYGPHPRWLDRPNLQPQAEITKTFRAPEGTGVISRGAPVISSDPAPIIGKLEMVTDGNKEGDDASYVELGPGKQWVQIDLGMPREIWGLVVWHHHKGYRAYDDVVVQLSGDPEFDGIVRTAFNNDHDNSSGFGIGDDPAWVETNHGRIIEAGGAVARYVRLYSNGNTSTEMNHYVEVEVWGR